MQNNNFQYFISGVHQRKGRRKHLTVTQCQVLLQPLLDQAWYFHTMRRWPVLHISQREWKKAQKKGAPPPSSTSRLIFHFSWSCHLQPTTSLIFFFTQGLQVDPMTPFLSKLSTLLLFMKKLHPMKSIHQGRSKPSWRSVHQGGLLLKWSTHPAQLLIAEARRNSSLNKLCGGTTTFDVIWDMYGLVWWKLVNYYFLCVD